MILKYLSLACFLVLILSPVTFAATCYDYETEYRLLKKDSYCSGVECVFATNSDGQIDDGISDYTWSSSYSSCHDSGTCYDTYLNSMWEKTFIYELENYPLPSHPGCPSGETPLDGYECVNTQQGRDIVGRYGTVCDTVNILRLCERHYQGDPYTCSDDEPPVISDVSQDPNPVDQNIWSRNVMHFSWTTDEPATGEVWIKKPGETVYTQYIWLSDYTTSHSEYYPDSYSGVAWDTGIYYYYVVSVDEYGNDAQSDVNSFQIVDTREPDIQGPNVLVNGYYKAAIEKGDTVTISTGTLEPAKICLYYQTPGASWSSPVCSSGYVTAFYPEILDVVPGEYNYYVTAVDKSNNKASKGSFKIPLIFNVQKPSIRPPVIFDYEDTLNGVFNANSSGSLDVSWSTDIASSTCVSYALPTGEWIEEPCDNVPRVQHTWGISGVKSTGIMKLKVKSCNLVSGRCTEYPEGSEIIEHKFTRDDYINPYYCALSEITKCYDATLAQFTWGGLGIRTPGEVLGALTYDNLTGIDDQFTGDFYVSVYDNPHACTGGIIQRFNVSQNTTDFSYTWKYGVSVKVTLCSHFSSDSGFVCSNETVESEILKNYQSVRLIKGSFTDDVIDFFNMDEDDHYGLAYVMSTDYGVMKSCCDSFSNSTWYEAQPIATQKSDIDCSGRFDAMNARCSGNFDPKKPYPHCEIGPVACGDGKINNGEICDNIFDPSYCEADCNLYQNMTEDCKFYPWYSKEFFDCMTKKSSNTLADGLYVMLFGALGWLVERPFFLIIAFLLSLKYLVPLPMFRSIFGQTLSNRFGYSERSSARQYSRNFRYKRKQDAYNRQIKSKPYHRRSTTTTVKHDDGSETQTESWDVKSSPKKNKWAFVLLLLSFMFIPVTPVAHAFPVIQSVDYNSPVLEGAVMNLTGYIFETNESYNISRVSLGILRQGNITSTVILPDVDVAYIKGSHFSGIMQELSFDEPGFYNVTLTVWNTAINDSSVNKTVVVEVYPYRGELPLILVGLGFIVLLKVML